eukprot:2984139-Rhodomonas_salina.2
MLRLSFGREEQVRVPHACCSVPPSSFRNVLLADCGREGAALRGVGSARRLARGLDAGSLDLLRVQRDSPPCNPARRRKDQARRGLVVRAPPLPSWSLMRMCCWHASTTRLR